MIFWNMLAWLPRAVKPLDDARGMFVFYDI